MLDVFYVAALGTRGDLQLALSAASPAKASVLKAVLAQYNGDVDGAIQLLKRQIAKLNGRDRAPVADLLAPCLVMRHENAAVMRLADDLKDGGWVASAHAFRALAYADAGNREAAKRQAAAAHAALHDEPDDVIRCRVLQRLARTAYYLHEYEKALDLTLACAKLGSEIGAWRTTAAAYSIAYSVQCGVIGDFEEADRYARQWHLAAIRCDDESFVQQARGAEYELAVQFADDARIQTLEREIRASTLPQQYNERFALALAYAIVRGASDLVAMRTLLQTVSDLPKRSRGEWALCMALIALSRAAENDDAGARLDIERGIARLGRKLASNPAYENYYRRVARATIAATRVLIGDDALATRTMEANESRQGHQEECLPALMQRGRFDDAPFAVRGLARVFENARNRRTAMLPPAGLTSAEFAVLKLLGCGWTAGKIARETGRSVQTVYNHTHAILSKLDASSASEAVATARSSGLLA